MSRKRYQKLHRIYDQVPSMNCKGLCHTACSVLGMSEYEAQQMTKAGGTPPAVNDKLQCVYLDVDKRCSIYNDRPMICRMYGHIPELACEHGCVPTRFVSKTFLDTLLNKIDREFGLPVFSEIPDTYKQ